MDGLKSLAEENGGQTTVSKLLTKTTDLNMPQTKGKVLDRRSAIDRVTSKPRHWLPQEDMALRMAVAELGEKKWKLIAKRVPGRNHTQCFQRWNKVLCPGLKKGKWCRKEDLLLIQLATEQLEAAKESGNTKKRLNWGLVCKNIPGRTAKQCRERWVNNLNPEINKGGWTEQEDKMVIELNILYPKKWALIAKQLKGRTENAVKIRYHTLERNMRTPKSAVRKYVKRQRSRTLNDQIIPMKKNMKLDSTANIEFVKNIINADTNALQKLDAFKIEDTNLNEQALLAQNLATAQAQTQQQTNSSASVQAALLAAQLAQAQAQAQNNLLVQQAAMQQLMNKANTMNHIVVPTLSIASNSQFQQMVNFQTNLQTQQQSLIKPLQKHVQTGMFGNMNLGMMNNVNSANMQQIPSLMGTLQQQNGMGLHFPAAAFS